MAVMRRHTPIAVFGVSLALPVCVSCARSPGESVSAARPNQLPLAARAGHGAHTQLVASAASAMAYLDWYLLDMQHQYIVAEGPSRRGEKFMNLVGAIDSYKKNGGAIKEFELLALLGRPDYSASADGRSEYAYLYDRPGGPRSIVLITTDKNCRVAEFEYNAASAVDLKTLPSFQPLPVVKGSEFVKPEAYLGIRIGRMHPLLQKPGEEHAVPGIWVREVAPESPAAESGLQAGDLIYETNGTSVANDDEVKFLAKLSEFRPGEEITLLILRDNPNGADVRVPLKIRLGRRPTSNSAARE
ncbi:MAG: 2-alkenal reductase [Phycisphaerales bacterium]|nr:2-alkenal reductase [Phycisphaerales bacterium]